MGTTANGTFVAQFVLDIVDDQSQISISMSVLYSAPSTNHFTLNDRAYLLQGKKHTGKVTQYLDQLPLRLGKQYLI